MFIKKLLINVYPPDGITYHPSTANSPISLYGRTETYQTNEGRAYITDPLTLLFSFLGLPHRLIDLKSKQSVTNMLKNFIGWRDKVSPLTNYLYLPLFTLFHLVTVPFKFGINVLKLFTEFFPEMLTRAAYMAFIKFHWMSDDDAPGSKLFIIPAVLSALLVAASAVATAVGNTITSPVDSIKLALAFARESKIEALIISMPITAALFETFVYTFALPLAIAALITPLSVLTPIILSPFMLIGVVTFAVTMANAFLIDFLRIEFYEDFINIYWFDSQTLQNQNPAPVQQPDLQQVESDAEDHNTLAIMQRLENTSQPTIVILPPAAPVSQATTTATLSVEKKEEQDSSQAAEYCHSQPEIFKPATLNI